MTDNESLVFYVLCFSLSALLLHIGINNSRRILRWLGLTIPILVGGLRYYVGTDYASYVRMYQSLTDTNIYGYFSDNKFKIEPAFYALIKFSQLISDQPYVLFMLSSILTIVFFYFGLKKVKSDYKALIFLLFLVVIFPITLNAMRQGIAISISFLALNYMISHENKKFLWTALLAAAFHASALVLLPVYIGFKFLRSKHDLVMIDRYLLKNISFIVLLILLIPTIFHYLPELSITEKYLSYGNYISGVSHTTIAFKIIAILTITYFYKRLAVKNLNMPDYYTLALFEVSTIGLWISSAALFRISLMFTPFSLILMAELINIFKYKWGKMIAQISLFIFIFIYFYTAYYIAGQAEIMPYQFIKNL